MRYMAKGYKIRTGMVQEGAIYDKYSLALSDAMDMHRSKQYKVIVILSDSEGADHPDNAGKFFLHRIIK